MSDEDEISQLISDIAVRHNIAVGRDDPILVLATVNKRLLADSAAAQEQLLQRFEAEIERIASTWSDDALAKAQRLLRSSTDEARLLFGDVARRSAESVANAIALQLRAEVQAASTTIAESVKAVKAVRALVIATAISGVLVLGTTLYVVLTVLP